MQVITKLMQGTQMSPRSFSDGLKGHFVKINQCKDCEAVGDTHELFYLDPCPNCGGSINDEIGVAKWNKEREAWEMRTGFSKSKEPETPEFYEKDNDEEIVQKESFFARLI